MISIHPLLPKLRQLNLSGMLNTLDLRVEQAIQEQLAPMEFLPFCWMMSWNAASKTAWLTACPLPAATLPRPCRISTFRPLQG